MLDKLQQRLRLEPKLPMFTWTQEGGRYSSIGLDLDVAVLGK